jgi:hypothetical protein
MQDRGVSPNTAWDQTIREFQQYVRQQEIRDLQLRAQAEQFSGVIGEATMALQNQSMMIQQQSAMNRQIMGQIRNVGGGGRQPMIGQFPGY